MKIFALEIVENQLKYGVFIAHKQIYPLAARKGIFALLVDRPIDQPTVNFLTVVPAVDRPVDHA